MYGRAISSICIIAVIFFLRTSFSPAFAAEPLLITAEGEYVMGAGETMEVAEERAKKKAMQSAAEKAGAWVKSHTQVNNLSLESDVIEVIANHAMKVRILEKQKTPIGDLEAIRFYVKIEAKMTAEEIEANLDKIRKDQSIADAYHRLKADYEKKDRDMEKLKKELELATGGDRRRIARLISEEEKKYKANLWLERGRSLGPFQSDEALKAYRKALELNAELAQAYVGSAEALRNKNLGEPQEVKQMEEKSRALKEALSNLDKAISLEEDLVYAYVLRAELLRELRDVEKNLLDMGKKEAGEGGWEQLKWQYADRILSDLNRAIALNAPNKAELYYQRAGIHQEIAWKHKDDGNFEQAIADIDQAIALREEGDVHTLSGYWRVKANIYINAETFYRYHGHDDKAAEMRKLSDRCYQKVAQLEEREQTESRKERKKGEEEIEAFYQTEFGKLSHYLDESGWKEQLLGIDGRAATERIGEADKNELEKQIAAKHRSIQQKVASGNATAEEYLLAGYFAPGDDRALGEKLIQKGISLMEKRNPEGKEALLLVSLYRDQAWRHETNKRYDAALAALTKARAVADAHLAQARKSMSLEEFWRMFRVMTRKEETPERMDLLINLVKNLDREQAESWHWIQYALTISRLKAQIYERLDLPLQARREYQHLCVELKEETACQDLDRIESNR